MVREQVQALLVTGLAAYLPARRATRIEPTRALRYEWFRRHALARLRHRRGVGDPNAGL